MTENQKSHIMTLSKTGLDFIKKWESLSLKAYKCPKGIWTIGYGHTSGVKPGMQITKEEAEALIKKDVFMAESAVNELQQFFSYPVMSQNEYDALVSLVFNIGTDAFRKSTLRKYIILGYPKKTIADQFLVWTYVNKKYCQGLQNRRREERQIYLNCYQ